jgi:hypothetical protein
MKKTMLISGVVSLLLLSADLASAQHSVVSRGFSGRGFPSHVVRFPNRPVGVSIPSAGRQRFISSGFRGDFRRGSSFRSFNNRGFSRGFTNRGFRGFGGPVVIKKVVDEHGDVVFFESKSRTVYGSDRFHK